MANNGEAYRRAFLGTGDTGGGRTPAESWAQQRKLTPMQGGTTLSRQEYIEKSGRTPVGNISVKRPEPERVVPKADTDPQRQRNAIGFIKGMSRELTDEEWNRLTEPQKRTVQFNGELMNAWDADMKDSRAERRNTKALLSQVGLDERTEGEVTDKLGLGLGPVARFDELFAKPASGVSVKDKKGDQYTAPALTVVADPKNARQTQVNQIAAKLDSFLRGLAETRGEADNETALARGEEFSFSDSEAKSYFEMSFEFLRDRENLNTDATWAAGLENLRLDGYDPEDFKQYALERIQLLPVVKGQTTVEELQSWFGK